MLRGAGGGGGHMSIRCPAHTRGSQAALHYTFAALPSQGYVPASQN